MTNIYRLYSTSYRIFGRSVREKDLGALSLNLKKAEISLPADIYLSSSRLIASMLALIGGIIGVFAGYVFISSGFEINPELMVLLTGSIGAILFYVLTERACIGYPIFKANTRRISIDRSLLHGINYLYAMAKGGMSLLDSFKSLKRHEEVYGEFAREIGHIVRDVEYFGVDLKTALLKASENTPSEKFRDLIGGLISVMNTGGSIENYLTVKSDQYQDLAEDDNEFFLDKLAMLAETYVTLFVAAPLFLITIILVLGMLKSGTILILSAIVYIIIPVGTLLFIILLNLITTKTDDKMPSFQRIQNLNVFDDIKVVGKGNEGIVDAFKKHKQIEKLKFFLHSPFGFFIEKPSRCFYITIPISLIYLMTQLYPAWQIPAHLDRSIFFCILILLIPYSISFEIRAKRIRKIEDTVPEFLRQLKSVNETGLNLIECIRVIIQSNLGVLTREIKRVSRSIEWGNTLEDAFHRLEKRVRTGALSRAVTLLVDADRATGNLKDVLKVAASNAEITQKLNKRRRDAMSIYLMIVYITFAVFLFTIYIITTKFLGGMPMVSMEGAEKFLSSDFNLGLYESVLFHGSLIQGFFSGIVGGQMASTDIHSGIKHAIVMMVGAFLVFEFLIWR